MAVLQLASPCLATSFVTPACAATPSIATAATVDKASGAATAAATASPPPPPPPPLVVIGVQGGLLLLEIVSDPQLSEADSTLRSAAERAQAADAADHMDAAPTDGGIGLAEADGDATEEDTMARRRRVIAGVGASDAAEGQGDKGDAGAAGTGWVSAGWRAVPGGAGLDLGRDWQQRVQVRVFTAFVNCDVQLLRVYKYPNHLALAG